MRVAQIYRTESDWCALVEAQTSLGADQRLTLTYPLDDKPPDEAQVLDDAESVFAEAVAGDAALPELGIEEGTTLNDKKAVISDQVQAAAALAGTEPELAEVTAALDDVVKQLESMASDAQAVDAKATGVSDGR